jgi:hypothetical protein
VSEPIVTQQPAIEPSPDTAALAALKAAHQEVLAKRSKDKARIAELEASAAALQTRATEAEARIRQLTIDGPINILCEAISVAPQALRTALESDYRIDSQSGVLTLLNASDGTPVTSEDGKPVPFQADAIKKLLLSSKDEAKLKLFNAILIASKASGAAGSPSKRGNATAPAKPTFQFGLR